MSKSYDISAAITLADLRTDPRVQDVVATFWKLATAFTDVSAAVEVLAERGIVDYADIDTDQPGRGAFSEGYGWPMLAACDMLVRSIQEQSDAEPQA